MRGAGAVRVDAAEGDLPEDAEGAQGLARRKGRFGFRSLIFLPVAKPSRSIRGETPLMEKESQREEGSYLGEQKGAHIVTFEGRWIKGM